MYGVDKDVDRSHIQLTAAAVKPRFSPPTLVGVRKVRSPTNTAVLTAYLLVHIILEFDREKGKTSTRVRFSSKTVRKVAQRGYLPDAFLAELAEVLAALGWSYFRAGDHHALIRTDTAESWPRLASTRIAETLNRVSSGDDAVFAKLEAQIVENNRMSSDSDQE